MTSDFDPVDLLLDVELLSVDAIALQPDQIQQAVAWSNALPTSVRRWQTYLRSLALLGFEDWLGERAPGLRVNRDRCTLLQPTYANVLEAVCNLEVNRFRVCLVMMSSLTDAVVSVPRAAVELPEFVAQVYVAVEVEEEQNQVRIGGFLRRDQLMMRLQETGLRADEDWMVEIPVDWLNPDPDALLLYLECLDPAAISLPAPVGDRAAQLAHQRADLMARLPELRSPQRLLWQVLTWEQGVTVLTHPELLDWVYQLQMAPSTSSPTLSLSNAIATLLQRVRQPVINVGRWLQGQLDDLSDAVSWMLLPPLTPATSGLRSRMETPVDEIRAILSSLVEEGIVAPAEVRGAFQDLELGATSLRLYALAWVSSQPEEEPEWALLLVLGTRHGLNLPAGTQLSVSEQATVLDEQMAEPTAPTPYLYTCVTGAPQEQFQVTIRLSDGMALTLPPFTFDLGEE